MKPDNHDGSRLDTERKPKAPPTQQISVRLPAHLLIELDAMATERCITHSDVLRKLLEQAAEWRK